jgi:hypothetical protein
MTTMQKRVTSSSAQPVFDRYTDDTRKAIYYASQEAEHRGDAVITVADLLAGLSVDEGTRAERVGSLKSNAFYLRWLVGLPALPARYSDSIECLDHSTLELDTEAKRAFSFALMEADRDNEYWIDSDHLLRGLMRFPNKAHFAVLKTEIDLTMARAASHQDRQMMKPAHAPDRKVMRFLVRKYAAMGAPVISLACYLYILFQGFAMTVAPMAK